MKKIIKYLSVIFILLITNSSILFGQSFQNKILVDIPGNNYNFDLQASETYPGAKSYITWINKKDSIYTVFLKMISPEISDSNIIISSDSNIKLNPRVSNNPISKGIKIVWESYDGEYYKIVGRNLFNDTLRNKFLIQDSLINNPQISLSMNRIVWVNEGNLYLKEFYPNLSNPILVDTSTCSSPNIRKQDDIQYAQILYEKIDNENHQIYLAKFNSYLTPMWNYEIVSEGNNRNPNFGIEYDISFETIKNGISRIKYSINGDIFMQTTNQNCNYKNPNLFSYPVPTSSSNNTTPFFVAFDTDSLENNNEIFIKTFYFGLYDSLINISNMEGNDYNPKVAYVKNNDTIYVAIIWLHQNNSKTNIWMSKEVFNPIYSSVKNNNVEIKILELKQNYPNPFNPITNIEYNIYKATHVEIKIFDILGNCISTLVNRYQFSGKHSVKFNGSNLSSGVYFYTIRINGITKTKSMILIK